MGKYTNAEIVKGIMEKSSKIFYFLYEEYFPMIKKMTQRNNGAVADAEDLFQDTVIIIFTKIRSKDLKLTSSFKTYFYAIAKYLWYQRLELLKRTSLRDSQENVWENSMDYEEYLDFEEEKLYQKHFLNLDEDCKKILEGYFAKKPYRELADNLNFSHKYIKKLKFNCKEKLYRSIINDPIYMELMELKKDDPIKNKYITGGKNTNNKTHKGSDIPGNHENKKRNKLSD